MKNWYFINKKLALNNKKCYAYIVSKIAYK